MEVENRLRKDRSPKFYVVQLVSAFPLIARAFDRFGFSSPRIRRSPKRACICAHSQF